MVNWILIKVLGQGSYGTVYLAKLIIGPLNYFAIKVSPLQYHSSLLREEQILKYFIGCPKIVQYLGSKITVERDSPCKAYYNLKLEYAGGGTLYDMIKQQNKLPQDEVKDYLKMIFRALSYIHREGFVHMDLKPANILAFPQSSGGKMKLKIADFGLSKRYEKRDDEEGVVFGLPKFRVTPKYMSSESIVLIEANSAFDIWSLGCILVKMVSEKSAWNDCKSHQELITRLLDDVETPTIPKKLSEQGKDFIQKCFDRDYINNGR